MDMTDTEMHVKMWHDLLTTEREAQAAGHRVIARAEVYLAAGLPLERVLDGLGLSRATWYRRVEALREWEAGNRAAGEGLRGRPFGT